jgi:hypothetical protein
VRNIATAGVTYVCGDWSPESRIIELEPWIPSRYPTMPTSAEELCNPGPAMRIEIKKKFFELVQLRSLDVLPCLIWMGDEHYSSIRFSELFRTQVAIKWVEPEEIEYVYLLQVPKVYADHFDLCRRMNDVD